jgi:hypothetical protein
MPQLSPELTARIKEEAEQNEYDTQRLVPAWAYISVATKYALLLQDAERRNKEYAELLTPLLDYGQSKEANIPLGASITAVILERAKQVSQSPVEGPWKFEVHHEAAHPESGCSGDQVVTITDGKVTLFVNSNEDEDGEQKLVNLLNQLKIGLDYDHSAEHVASYLQERLKQLEDIQQGVKRMRWMNCGKQMPAIEDWYDIAPEYIFRGKGDDPRSSWFVEIADAELIRELAKKYDYCEWLCEDESASDNISDGRKPLSF